MNEYQKKLKQLLIASPLTTGFYKPSKNIQTIDHAAIFVDGKPVYLSGYADCEDSIREANQLADAEMFRIGLELAGITGEISHGIVHGRDINWEPEYSAIVTSESGVFEAGEGKGILVGINLTQKEPLSVLICVNDSLARILNPNAPTLDNGKDLALLARIYSKERSGGKDDQTTFKF
ncbi:hypothetical protein HUO09_17680 [Vibrio sp. Y2-5]|uniref:hypothetical protein n=1 Tax=Vibrio sp. Y2-5 TaxID=2743977 RepID=UPI0016601C1B|nr:hypothetical protein [Vibrio sp. Y2-5]MBD0788189.1 hypothetical protein [Vibrio sp. Y2-5]